MNNLLTIFLCLILFMNSDSNRNSFSNSSRQLRDLRYNITNNLNNPLKVRIVYEYSVFYNESQKLVINSNLCDASNFLEVFDNGDFTITTAPGVRFKYKKISDIENSESGRSKIIKNKVRNFLGADHTYTLVMWDDQENCELSIEFETPQSKKYIRYTYILDFKKKVI